MEVTNVYDTGLAAGTCGSFSGYFPLPYAKQSTSQISSFCNACYKDIQSSLSALDKNDLREFLALCTIVEHMLEMIAVRALLESTPYDAIVRFHSTLLSFSQVFSVRLTFF